MNDSWVESRVGMKKLINSQLNKINKVGRYSDGNNLYFVVGKKGNSIFITIKKL